MFSGSSSTLILAALFLQFCVVFLLARLQIHSGGSKSTQADGSQSMCLYILYLVRWRGNKKEGERERERERENKGRKERKKKKKKNRKKNGFPADRLASSHFTLCPVMKI
jgi:hypothetical protein